MILYHGTNADFDHISLTIGLRHKDFGWGFYLTPDRQTAIRMAQKKARLFGGADRKNDKPIHDYDIVIGPIADDGVVLQLTNYRQGIYSPEEAARLLQDRYLDQQYYFGTERAVRFLSKTNAETV